MARANADSYLGNPRVKRDGAQQQFTKKQLQEYKKCMESAAYFARNYVKVIHLDKGLVKFDLYPYQEKMFEHFEDNRFNIVLACRQSGKSISSCAYLLWFALFRPEQNIAILANKAATAKEMLARITLMLENIPFFLQPGCKELNKSSVAFSNNSRIFASATSGSSIRGQSVNLLYLDEFAFVQDATTFYTSTYPVVTSGASTKVIITSTANGIGNQFHKIWEGALQQTNEYKPFTVNWWDVPGRDEKWKKQTIGNTSELQFQQEFENSFLGHGSTLINGDTLLKLRAEVPVYTQGPIKVYEKPEKDHNYILTVDVCQGRGQDYSTFSIIDVTEKPFKQVCTFRDNNISPLLFPDHIYKYAKIYNDALVIVEKNDAGQLVTNALYYDIEYENVFVESMTKSNGVGVTMNKKVKRIGCSNLKDLIEQGKLIVKDTDTIIELSTFEARGTSYEASDGNHDDTVMCLVIFSWYLSTPMFSNSFDIEIRDLVYREQMQVIESELVPFGIIDDGIDDNTFVADGDLWKVDTGDSKWLFGDEIDFTL